MFVLLVRVQVAIGVHFHTAELARVELLACVRRRPVFRQIERLLEPFPTDLTFEIQSHVDKALVFSHRLQIWVRLVANVAFGFLRLVYVSYMTTEVFLSADPRVADSTLSSVRSCRFSVNDTMRFHLPLGFTFLSANVTDVLGSIAVNKQSMVPHGLHVR